MTYFGHIMRKKGKCLEKEIIQGTTRVPAKSVDEIIGQYQTLDGADKGRTVEERQMWKIVVHDAVQCCHSKRIKNLYGPIKKTKKTQGQIFLLLGKISLKKPTFP